MSCRARLASAAASSIALLFLPVCAHAADCGIAPSDASAVVRLTAAPFVDAGDAATRMQCIADSFRATRDRRAVFAAVYAHITNDVATAIHAHAFADDAWTERYLLAFADAYRVAIADYEAGRTTRVTPAWRIAFDASRTRHALIVEELLLGVNAHVNDDLARALYTVGIGWGLERVVRYADHVAVNRYLEAAVDDETHLVGSLFAPGLLTIGASLESIAEGAFLFNLEAGRERAWRHAVALTDATPLGRAIVEQAIDVGAVGGARAIRGVEANPPLFSALFAIERATF